MTTLHRGGNWPYFPHRRNVLEVPGYKTPKGILGDGFQLMQHAERVQNAAIKESRLVKPELIRYCAFALEDVFRELASSSLPRT